MLLEEREGIVNAKSQVQQCKDKLNHRAERYLIGFKLFLIVGISCPIIFRFTMTLSLTHDAIHAISEEASYLKNQFQYISTQV